MGTLIVNQYLSKLWTPANITTALWLDAADSSTITLESGVQEWRDKSGNNYHAYQYTSDSQPIVNATGLNNLPVVQFDGINDFFNLPLSAKCPDTFTMFMILKTDPRPGENGSFNASYYAESSIENEVKNNIYYRVNATGLAFDDFPPSGNGSYTGTNTFVNDTVIASAVRYNANQKILFVNGVSYNLGIETYSSGAITNILLGYRNGIVRYVLGYIAEFLRVSTDDDLTRQKIEGYLAHKWGLTANLPVIHPYKNTPPYA